MRKTFGFNQDGHIKSNYNKNVVQLRPKQKKKTEPEPIPKMTEQDVKVSRGKIEHDHYVMWPRFRQAKFIFNQGKELWLKYHWPGIKAGKTQSEREEYLLDIKKILDAGGYDGYKLTE